MSAAAGSSPTLGENRCRAGSVLMKIAGKRICVRPGNRCRRRHDRSYHRYGFHCHNGRVTRPRRRQPPPPPPPPPPPQPTANIVATIRVGIEPRTVAIGEGAAWVANDGSVSRIDPATNAVIATITLPMRGMTWVATGMGAVWVSIAGSNHTVVRIDPASNTVAAAIQVGIAPERPAPLVVGHGAVWATNFQESTLARIDPATNSVTAKIATSPDPRREDLGHPSGVAVTAGAVWVVNHREAKVLRVDPVTNQIISSFMTQDGRATAAEDSVWISSAGGDLVDRIDVQGGRVTATITGCTSTNTLAVGGGSVWVAEGRNATLCRIDAASNSKAVSLLLRDPSGRMYNDPFGVAYGAGSVWVVDAASGMLLRVMP